MGLFLIFLCFVGSYLLYINRNKEKTENLYLSALYLVNGLQGFTHIFMINQFQPEISAVFSLHLAPLSFTIGPLLYFYLKKIILPNSTISIHDLWHLLPSILFLILILPYYSLPFQEKIEWMKAIKNDHTKIFDIPLLVGTSSLFFILRPISVISYILISIKFTTTNIVHLKKYYSYFQEMILIRWIQMILITSTIIYISNLLYTVNAINTRSLNIITSISILGGIGFGFLCIQLFINPYILYGFSQIRYHSNDSFLSKLYFIPQKLEVKFTEVWAIEIEKKILSHEESFAYLKKGYTIKNMADELSIPMYQLNYYFKEIYKDSFSNWKNIKRIDYATKLIMEGFLDSSTLENLSIICGYSSRSNFNDAFKMVKNQNIKSFLSTLK